MADQDALTGYLQLHRMSLLPNNFNYKPYWGPIETGPLWGPYGEVVIAHTHGPKIDQVLCIHKYLAQAESCFEYDATLRWDSMWPRYESSCPEVRFAWRRLDFDETPSRDRQPPNLANWTNLFGSCAGDHCNHNLLQHEEELPNAA